MTLTHSARRNGHTALPPRVPEIPAKLQFQRILFSEPISFAAAGWRGDVGKLGVIYDLARVMSLPEHWDELMAAELAESDALTAQVALLQSTFNATWAPYLAAARAHGQSDGKRVADLAALLAEPAVTAADICARARALLMPAEPAPEWAPTAAEATAYEAAVAEVVAETGPLEAAIARIQQTVAHKVIAWCVVQIAELVTRPPTRLDPTIHQELRWEWAGVAPDPRVPASYDVRVDPAGLLEGPVVEWLAQGALDEARKQLQSPPYARR